MRPLLVYSDRDGTINEDENYYLGTDPNWTKQVAIKPSVINGINLVNSLDNSHFFIITNQTGVALQGTDPVTGMCFDNLTGRVMHDVNMHILCLLRGEGAFVKAYQACPYVDNKYVEKAKRKGRTVNPKFVRDGHPDLKPNIGMLNKCIVGTGMKLETSDVYVIGDRFSDVMTGINAGGHGILVASEKTVELGDVERVKALELGRRTYIAQDFLDAAQFISRNRS